METQAVELTNTDLLTINRNLGKMDLPINRRDASRQDTVRWLCLNLNTRNKSHPLYAVTMDLLLAQAIARNLFKAKEIKHFKEQCGKHNSQQGEQAKVA